MTQAQLGPLIFIAIIIIILAIRVVRMSREQRFQPRSMWILPAIFAVLTATLIVFDRLTSPLDVALMLAALAVGFGFGWYQGTHTTVRVDHSVHAMFVKISPVGSLIWIGVLALRFGVRYVTGPPMPAAATTTDPQAALAASAHTPAGLISTLLLVLAVGMIFGLRAYLQRVYQRERAAL